MDGSSSNGTAGGTHRRGPAKLNGEARSAQIGSVSTLLPSIWITDVEWPIHVTLSEPDAVRGRTMADAASAKDARSGWSTRGPFRRSQVIHRSTLPKPAGVDAGHGFRNPPVGR